LFAKQSHSDAFQENRYAIVALTRLAREYGKGPIQIREIQSASRSSAIFGRHIAGTQAGYIRKQAWQRGRVFLLKNPADESYLTLSGI
jgi:hypothetical protein